MDAKEIGRLIVEVLAITKAIVEKLAEGKLDATDVHVRLIAMREQLLVGLEDNEEAADALLEGKFPSDR